MAHRDAAMGGAPCLRRISARLGYHVGSGHPRLANMQHTPLWQSIGQAVSLRTGVPAEAIPRGRVSGGDINEATRLEHGGTPYFVKLNRAGNLAMFEAEAAGLDELAAARALRVPAPVAWGEADGRAYLVLEYLELRRHGDAAALGEGLARLHAVTRDRHGWTRDNTIGSTPQPNGPDSDWIRFWRERRLGHQLELARERGGARRLRDRGQLLLERLPGLFGAYRPAASLLHGDLWGGNFAFLDPGTPVLFDPAVYYGDRETDLAMTELFGGFGPDFYAAYRAAWPLDAGYAVRRRLYQLYHVINHYNLFGGGYLGQAERLVDSLLAELG